MATFVILLDETEFCFGREQDLQLFYVCFVERL